jgi:hypothetical protein
MTEYYVLSQGLADGPFDKARAVEFLYQLCAANNAPPERYKSTVIFSKVGNYQDVVKYHGTKLDGIYVYWNKAKMQEILADLDNVV